MNDWDELVDHMEHAPLFADCPHCNRYEFRDEDDWFEHVSECQYEQHQAMIEGQGEEE